MQWLCTCLIPVPHSHKQHHNRNQHLCLSLKACNRFFNIQIGTKSDAVQVLLGLVSLLVRLCLLEQEPTKRMRASLQPWPARHTPPCRSPCPTPPPPSTQGWHLRAPRVRRTAACSAPSESMMDTCRDFEKPCHNTYKCSVMLCRVCESITYIHTYMS